MSVLTAKHKDLPLVMVVTINEVSGDLSAGAQSLLHSLDASFDAASFFKAVQFAGKAGQSVVAVLDGKPVVFVGVGALDKKSDENRETVRRALGTGYTKMQATGVEAFVVHVPDATVLGVERSTYLEQVATLLQIASYQFVSFKKEQKTWRPAVYVAGTTAADADSLEAGGIIGRAMNKARTLADTPPNHMYPALMAEQAAAIAKEYGLKYTVITQDEARDMGMGCFYSVAKGSENEGKIVILEYAPAHKDAPVVALVGKGVCFDTGGISLKPANYMTGMKYDMSGAAAVFAALEVCAQLKPAVRVIGITPLVENMPSGRASKQDDVVRALNGLYVEIENTDAEGRLILSDALTYVQQKYDPAVVLDIATLTGSCAATFGPLFAGLMTRDEGLEKELREIGNFVGDRVWPLPLVDDYKPAIESVVADITNCGSQTYKAGAITAGMFLECFIDKGRRWAHLDIAGTDSKIPGTTYLGRGATGTGVRIFVEYIRRFK